VLRTILVNNKKWRICTKNIIMSITRIMITRKSMMLNSINSSNNNNHQNPLHNNKVGSSTGSSILIIITRILDFIEVY